MDKKQVSVKLKHKRESEESYFAERDQKLLRELRQTAAGEATRKYRDEHKYHCFRCGTKSLAEIDEGNIKIDICVNKNCGAIHLDPEPPQKTFTTSTEDKIQRIDPKARLVYAIRLNLRQPVSLARNPDVTVSAITWQTESVGLRRLAQIREDFENVVDVFIEAYLSENQASN